MKSIILIIFSTSIVFCRGEIDLFVKYNNKPVQVYVSLSYIDSNNRISKYGRIGKTDSNGKLNISSTTWNYKGRKNYNRSTALKNGKYFIKIDSHEFPYLNEKGEKKFVKLEAVQKEVIIARGSYLLPDRKKISINLKRDELSYEKSLREENNKRYLFVFLALIVVLSIYFVLNKSKTKSTNSRKDKRNRESSYKQSYTGKSDSKEKQYLELLGVTNDSDFEMIKKAYQIKIKEYHPDKVASMGEKLKTLALKRTKEINEAYEYFKKKYGK